MRFDWNPEKNEQIKKERGVSFEEISLLLANGQVWAVARHWNEERYPGQSIFLAPLDGYIFAIPYVKDGDIFFLKTAFPSRKLTEQYKREFGSENENA